MNYEDAARELAALMGEATTATDERLVAAAFEAAGAVHTEALLASLSAFNQAYRIVAAGPSQHAATTESGAALQPMPEKTLELRLDFPLTAEQLEILKPAHVPNDGWNRWYMEFDGDALRYYRNASGYCFFIAKVESSDDGYLVTDVTVNQDDKQYTETNPTVCAAQLKILLANDLGLDDEEYWDEMDG